MKNKPIKSIAWLSFILTAGSLSHANAQSIYDPVPPSYNERHREYKPRSGTKDQDPNVYVYTPEFAKRFLMPEEWISTELVGVDAVAYRVIPTYATCGWGGDPKACNTNEVRCEMDLYFDHKINPLPWDERYPPIYADRFKNSSKFIPAWTRESRLPKHPNWPSGLSTFTPFFDSKAGLGLTWKGGFWIDDSNRGGFLWGVNGYDREIFLGVAMVTMDGGCNGQPPDALWLTSTNARYQDKDQMFKRVTLPHSWRARVNDHLQDTKQRMDAFFKSEGEKALKALGR